MHIAFIEGSYTKDNLKFREQNLFYIYWFIYLFLKELKMTGNNDKYNKVEADGNILKMVITKPITAEGYNENFLTLFKSIIAEYGKVRTLIHYKDFKGWEQEATFDDLKAIAEYGKYLERYAFINPPQKEVLKAQLSKDLLPGEMRIFTEDQYDEAMAWLRE